VERRILIACVGNIFLGDDAFGVEVARRLAGRTLPKGVRAVDFGIRSYDLAYAIMEAWDLVILVDAAPRGGQPGTVYVIEPELPGATVDGTATSTAQAEPDLQTLDAHSMDPVAVLHLVHVLGGEVKRVVVVGCEPSPLDLSVAVEEAAMELSLPVRAAVDEAIRVIEGLISTPASFALTGFHNKVSNGD
jgi:hydrogenase maturation protease